MPAFYYKIKNQIGQISKGVLATDSVKEARTLLSSKEFTLITLKPLKIWQKVFCKGELKPLDMLYFFKTLSQLCRAGLPLREALYIFDKEGKKYTYRPLIRFLEQGFSLSKSLRKSTLLNNEFLLFCLEQSERTGDYPHGFDQIVSHLQWKETLKKRLKKIISYPLCVFLLTVGLLMFLLTFVVPQLLDLYKMSNLEAPPMTHALLVISHYTAPFLITIGGGLVFAFLIGFSVLYYGRYNVFLRNQFLFSFLKTPFLGSHLRDLLLLQYMTSIRVILEAQKDNIIGAMSCAEDALRPSFFQTLFSQPRFSVEAGSSFSQALHKNFPLPESIFKILQVGEKSGSIPVALKHITDYIDKNLQDLLEKFIQRLGPFMLLLVGGFLLLIIIAIFLPLYGGLGVLDSVS